MNLQAYNYKNQLFSCLQQLERYIRSKHSRKKQTLIIILRWLGETWTPASMGDYIWGTALVCATEALEVW